MDILIKTAYYCLAYGGSGIMIIGTLAVGMWIIERFVTYLEDK